ncbi:unnamed protein product [Alternaria alternata]
MVVPDPGVGFFVSFNDLNPHTQKQCIYFVKKLRADRRCTISCSDDDNKRAIELYSIINKKEWEHVLVDEIKEYIESKCCREWHQNAILSSTLFVPLVKRWLDEIKIRKHSNQPSSHSTHSSTPTTPERTSETGSSVRSLCNTTASSATSRVSTVETPFSSRSYSDSNISEGSVVTPTSLQPKEDPVPLPCVSPITKAEPLEARKQHFLRFRADSLLELSQGVEHERLAEFTPRIRKPTFKDTVAWKMCEDLNVRNPKRDHETGMVYMYRRESSPGYIKIGWTAKSVEKRLEQWLKCGYTPIELFRATGVPHAQRVETLTHYELIKEWRKERPCEVCSKKTGKPVCHQEWFEVSKEPAIHILKTWVELFKKASPYELSGSLKSEWREVVNEMKKNNETVTSKKLLEHYEATVAKESVRTKETVKAEGVVFVEERSDAKQGADATEETIKNEKMVIKKEIVVKEEEITAELSTQ